MIGRQQRGVEESFGMTISVILSEAKDLMAFASGDEVLRCAQDDITCLAVPAQAGRTL